MLKLVVPLTFSPAKMPITDLCRPPLSCPFPIIHPWYEYSPPAAVTTAQVAGLGLGALEPIVPSIADAEVRGVEA